MNQSSLNSIIDSINTHYIFKRKSRQGSSKLRVAIDANEIEIMGLEVSNYKQCKFLQIGTKHGWAAFNMLRFLNAVNGTIDTVDIGGGKVDKWIKHVDSIIRKYDLDFMICSHSKGSDYFFNNTENKYHIIFIDKDISFPQASGL